MRAALNYILAALLLAFGIYNLTAGETAWGIVMTACGLLLIALTLLYPWLMGRSVEKIRGRLRAVRYVGRIPGRRLPLLVLRG